MLQIPLNIKQARELSGKTQKEMAYLLGVQRTTYANWETTTEPDIATIKKISQILGVSLTQLIAEDAPPHVVKESDTTYDLKDELIKLLKEKIQDKERIRELEKKLADKNGQDVSGLSGKNLNN